MGDPNAYYAASTVTSIFGPRAEYGGYHHGEDFAHPEGTPVPALSGGKVVKAGLDSSGQLGNEVVVETTDSSGKKIDVLYGHLADKIPLQVGQTINAGDIIGAVGGQSNASALGEWDGPHTHVGVQVNGAFVDPNSVIPAFLVAAKAAGGASSAVGVTPPSASVIPGVDAVTSTAGAVASVAGSIKDFMGILTSKKLWWSLAFIGVGLGLTATGSIIYLSSFKEVRSIEGDAAKAAAVA